MSELTVKIPEYLLQRAEVVAGKEQMSLDQLVSLALASHLSGWLAQDEMALRAKRGSWEKFQAVLDKAPDVEPAAYDKLNSESV
jgi:hypothetical protein